MTFPRASLLVIAALLCEAGHAQHETRLSADQQSGSVQGGIRENTPARQSILESQLQIKTDPKKVQPYNQLALAYIRRTRETADPRYLKDADGALNQGLKIAPEDFQLLRTRIALLLDREEFATAKEQALVLHHRMPDDVTTYGYLADAELALGDYADAEKNAQWMMNLRPNNIPALIVGAELRSLYGDAEGAIDFLSRASSETSPTEIEELAWIANRIAAIQIESGQPDPAEESLEQAEQTFPRYAGTIENLARVRMAQNRAGDAAGLLLKAVQIDGNPHIVYQLARAEQVAGQSKEAQATYAEFEKLASEPGRSTAESRLDLIMLYAQIPDKAPTALKLAQQEIAARQDVWTLDAYASALYANAKYQDADAAVQKALAVGIRSAQIYDHAGHIALKLSHNEDAARYFKLSAQSNPMSYYAADALKSAGLPAVAYAPEQKNRRLAPDMLPDADQQKTSRDPANASDEHQQGARLAKAQVVAPSPSFVPLPEYLLTPHPTGTARLIQSAQDTVTGSPTGAAGYTALGEAYLQRARETGDVTDYQLAEQSLNKSLNLFSVDFSADASLETMASVCMGEHRFSDALGYAQKGLSLGTGDVSSFAIVGDAYADMGEYDKAAVAYSRLTPRDMTLAPRAAYARDSRLSYLKFIAGDTPAAIKLMKTAVTEGVEARLQAENLAWLYYELGEYSTQAGDTASADQAYVVALTIHPGDYRALAALGKLRANNGRYAEAIVFYKAAIAVVPMPVFVAELGDLYAKSGDQAEAKKQYALVEYIGLLGHINQVVHNRDLALFYADHDMKLSESLELAKRELEIRHDIYTWDALAWALYKNGKLAEATETSQKALRFGTRDSLLLFHAGMIAERSGQAEKARSAFQEALQINPRFHLIYAARAQEQLNVLEVHAAVKQGPDQYAR